MKTYSYIVVSDGCLPRGMQLKVTGTVTAPKDAPEKEIIKFIEDTFSEKWQKTKNFPIWRAKATISPTLC